MHGRMVLLLTAVVGCDHSTRSESVADEQARERSELAEDQLHERTELAQDHTLEREEAPQEAREDLPSQTEEAAADRQEAIAETQRLQALVSQACATIAEPDQEACPLAPEQVESMRNVEDGVSIGLKRTAGSVAEIETRVNCYRARATLRADQMNGQLAQNEAGQVTTAQIPPAAAEIGCLVDYPDVEIDVNETRGRVFVELTADEDGEVVVLRSRARELTGRPRR